MTNKRKELNLLRILTEVLNDMTKVRVGSTVMKGLEDEYKEVMAELNDETDYTIQKYYRRNR